MTDFLFQARGALKPFWNNLWPLREAVRKLRIFALRTISRWGPGSHLVGPPKGYISSTRQWITSQCHAHSDELAQATYPKDLPGLIDLLPETRIERALPVHVNGEVHWKFEKDRLHVSPETFVVTMPAGRYWGYYGGNVISPDDLLLEDISRDIRPGADHEIFLQLKLPAMQSYDAEVAVLAAPEAERNYFHWMFDVLPRVHMLEQAGLDKQKIDYFLSNMDGLQFQNESLERVGIPLQKILRSDASLHLKARRLIVPSPAINSFFDTPAWVCEYLQALFSRERSTGVSSRELIYVTRSNARFRKVVNEAELLSMLEKYGFVAVSPDMLSIAEQASLFAGARVVVGAHGAGLVNLVFCQPGAKVIELFAPDFVQTNYWGISSAVGLEYFYLLGLGKQSPPAVDKLNRFQNIKVDLSLLARTLELAGVRR